MDAFERVSPGPFHRLLLPKTRVELSPFLPGRQLQDLETSSPASHQGSQPEGSPLSPPGLSSKALPYRASWSLKDATEG